MQAKLYFRNYAAALAAGVTYEDAMQTSYFAVLQAIRLFDPSRQGKFTTCLGYCVKGQFFVLIGMHTEKDRREPLSLASSLEEPISEEDEELPCGPVFQTRRNRPKTPQKKPRCTPPLRKPSVN